MYYLPMSIAILIVSRSLKIFLIDQIQNLQRTLYIQI